MSRIIKSLLGSVALTTLSLSAASAVESESLSQIIEGVVQATTGKSLAIAVDGEASDSGRIEGFTKIGKGVVGALTPDTMFNFGVDEPIDQKKAKQAALERLEKDIEAKIEAKITSPQVTSKDLMSGQNEEKIENSAFAKLPTQVKPLILRDANGMPVLNDEEMETYQDLRILNESVYDIAKLQSKRDTLDKKVAMLNEVSAELEKLKEGQVSLENSIFFDEDVAFHSGDLEGFELYALQTYRNKLRGEIDALENELKSHISNPQINFKFLQDNNYLVRAYVGATGRKAKVGDGGSFKEDDRGFITFNPATNRMNILVHGSRNDDDWDANFDGELVPLTDFGYSRELVGDARVHRGFANIAFASMKDVKEQMRVILSMVDNPQDVLSKLIINVSGHSQGAAVAELMAYFLVLDMGEELFGTGYNNATQNRVRAIVFSAPRPGDALFAEEYNAKFGKDNSLRVNVNGDPVPLTGPTETLVAAIKPLVRAAEWWAKNVPSLTPAFMQEKLFLDGEPLSERLDKMKGAKGVGVLALDGAGEVMKRNLLRKEVAFAALRAAGQDLVSGFAELSPAKVMSNAREAWNEGKRNNGSFLSATWNATKSIVGSLLQPVNGVVAAVTDLAVGIVAPFHYGSVEMSSGGAYDPKNVGTDPNAMLRAGFEHEKAKAEAAKAAAVKAEQAKQTAAQTEAERIAAAEVGAQTKPSGGIMSTIKGWFGY